MSHRILLQPKTPPAYDVRFFDGVFGRIFAALQTLSPLRKPYTVTNATESRTFDADTVTLPELADVVGTLLADLKSKGDLPDG